MLSASQKIISPSTLLGKLPVNIRDCHCFFRRVVASAKRLLSNLDYVVKLSDDLLESFKVYRWRRYFDRVGT
jgi:hypothetical protein